MGIKARDEEGCTACSACHAFLDGGYAGHMARSLVDVYFDLARAESQKILQRKGLMKGATGGDCESLPIANQIRSMGKDSTMSMISEQGSSMAADEVEL